MSKPPSPLFTFFGVEGGASCCCVGETHIFVGSQIGKIHLYDAKTKTSRDVIFVDKEKRRIQSIEFANDRLIVHVRSYAVLQLNLDTWEIIQTVETDHIGFCNSLLFEYHLLFVSTDRERFPKLCWTKMSEVKVESTVIVETADITPMCMTVGEKEENEVLIGMEDGSMAICYKDEHGFKCHATEKFSREPIFCIASCSKWIALGCARAPIHLWDRKTQTSRKVPYPPNSAGCSAIAFSPNEKQIVAGFSDGSIRVFSCSRLSVLLALPTAHSSTITSIIWLPPDEGNYVVATSSDGTVTMWRFN